MKSLSALTNLQQLGLAYNKKITDVGLKELGALNDLRQWRACFVWLAEGRME